MKRMARFLLILCAALVLFMYPVKADAASVTPIDDFEYTRKNSGAVLLTKYTGDDRSVTVPSSYFLDGISYPVVLASQTVFAGNANLTSVTVCSGVIFDNDSMAKLFAKCTALRTLKMQADTANVTDMSYLFYGCEGLETLDLSTWNTGNVTTMKAMFSNCTKLKKLTGYENWDTGSLRSIAYMFNTTEQLKEVDLSRWTLAQLENSGWCFQKCGASEILLPEDIAVISAGFFNHVTGYTGSSFTVPAGVKKIGYAHTIYDFANDDFMEFRVADGNTAYKAVDGILYSADGKEMLAIPRGKVFADKTYEIPEGITFLGELSFSRNYHMETVVLPDSYILKDVPVYDPAYILFEDVGNLNAGLNLNIAIYCYTGIRAYAVKESNPNYISIDGILYTKDGTAVVAVPTRYEGALNIPEGVTQWQNAAMWSVGETVDRLMKECSGVYIPASLTQIAPDQLDKLNRLEKRYSGFTITVSEENPVYYIGKSGQLLKKSNLADLQVTLSQDKFVYDGQPKTPDVTIIHKGKTLKAGKDYTISFFDNVNAGTGWVRITGCGDHYGTVECSFTITQAQPDYTLPQEIPGIYGQTLNEVALPEGFAWMQPDMTVGDVGVRSFFATYTKNDPNYVSLENIYVTVRVQPKPLGAEHLTVALWYPWTGRAVVPSVSVVDATGIVPTEEYTLSFEENISVGKGRAVLRDVPGGNYQISGTVEFYIVPGPFLCIAMLTVLWCLTTGLSLRKGKKVAPSKKQQKTR